jgi:hypothetical protein
MLIMPPDRVGISEECEIDILMSSYAEGEERWDETMTMVESKDGNDGESWNLSASRKDHIG